jgi:hypothetical protein
MRRRTLGRRGVVSPQVRTVSEATVPGPWLADAWYVEMPNVDNTASRDQLAKRYDLDTLVWVVRDGYALGARRLRLREPALRRPASDGSAATLSGAPLP